MSGEVEYKQLSALLASERMNISVPEKIADEVKKTESFQELRKVFGKYPKLFPTQQNYANFSLKDNKEFLSKHLEELLDYLDVGIWIVDADLNYVYVNQALLDLSKAPSKEAVLGSYCGDPCTKFDILMVNIIKEENKPLTAYQDVLNYRNDMHYRQLITQTPVFDENGKLIYIIAAVEKLSHLNERLEEAKNNHIKYVMKQSSASSDAEVISRSQSMIEILNIIDRISTADVTILIEGESGTGKEVIANSIHKKSHRSKGPMIVVNCSAIPEALFESELFGYDKGAFTGASNTGKKGLLEQANGGTLFLDEINSMPLSVQGKLLRALETKKFRRVGGTKDISSDFRIISATNQDLFFLCKEKLFREDLFYRLNIIPIRIPPLRNRREDILPLTEHFLQHFTTIYERNKVFSSKALKEIENYSWPGNVRELKNFVERAVITSESSMVEIQNIDNILSSQMQNDGLNEPPSTITRIEEGFSLSNYIDACEKEMVEKAIAQTKNTYDAAKLLGISQSTLVKKKQKYNL